MGRFFAGKPIGGLNTPKGTGEYQTTSTQMPVATNLVGRYWPVLL
jgi:hypothetical protein